MRLWSKQLVPYLPDEQLLGQWRECCAIASNMAKYGTPNHILVNRITEYPLDHFYTYSMILLRAEFARRGFFYKQESIDSFMENLLIYSGRNNFSEIETPRLFDAWMSTRYLQQCLLNIEEKYDCGGVELKDWFKILNGVRNMSVFCEETYENLFT